MLNEMSNERLVDVVYDREVTAKKKIRSLMSDVIV